MLLHELNEQYIRLHSAKEEAFWAEKMGLKESVPGDFEAKEIQLQAFITDAAMLPKLRAELERSDLTPKNAQAWKDGSGSSKQTQSKAQRQRRWPQKLWRWKGS
ncbi:MAG: hypothetical protein UZ07_CHB004002016 [Chlorobi bacterium OLB7]|nr:MAG: hypothetical protein UZ07_CHB004002016 [Chlorobi bacterium OLB7]